MLSCTYTQLQKKCGVSFNFKSRIWFSLIPVFEYYMLSCGPNELNNIIMCTLIDLKNI